MVKKISRGILVLLMGALSSATTHAQSEKVVVAVDKGYPPYMYGSQKDAKGLYPRQIRAIFSRINVEVDIKALPWKRALNLGEKGAAAVGGIYKNLERSKIYDYSHPIDEETISIYVRKGDAFPFKELTDLKGKKIGINFGWSYGEAFDKASKEGLFTVEESHTNLASLQMLVRKRIDCFVSDHLAVTQIIRQTELSDKIEKLEHPAAINKSYIVFAKSINKRELLDRFRHFLK